MPKRKGTAKTEKASAARRKKTTGGGEDVTDDPEAMVEAEQADEPASQPDYGMHSNHDGTTSHVSRGPANARLGRERGVSKSQRGPNGGLGLKPTGGA